MARLKAFAANIWARATGNVESPDANLFDNGWQGGAGANPPTSRHENWWHQRVDETLADIERYGVMTWVNGGTYDRGTLSRGSDGEIYVSTADANTNNPTTLTNWVKLDKGRIATESAPGNIEIATQAETDLGTLDNRAVTPKKLRFGFQINTSSNGYVIFPTWLGGLIIQWGGTGIINAGASVTVTLPVAFPNAQLRPILTPSVNSDSTTPVCGAIDAPTNTTLLIRNRSAAQCSIGYLTIGY